MQLPIANLQFWLALYPTAATQIAVLISFASEFLSHVADYFSARAKRKEWSLAARPQRQSAVLCLLESKPSYSASQTVTGRAGTRVTLRFHT